MMSVRVTLTLDEILIRKLREISPNNISAFVNKSLRNILFGKKESMAGVLKGKISIKDIEEIREHEF